MPNRRFAVLETGGAVNVLEDPAGRHDEISSAFLVAKTKAGWKEDGTVLRETMLQWGLIPGEVPRA